MLGLSSYDGDWYIEHNSTNFVVVSMIFMEWVESFVEIVNIWQRLFSFCFSNAGNQFLEKSDIPYETEWDYWVNVVALSSMTFVLFVFTYIALRRIKKYK